MKRISSKEEDLTTNVSLLLGEKFPSIKVRRSLAALGFALSAGTVGILVSQQSNNNNFKAVPVAASSRTLADVMSQNQDRKYEMARSAIASGAWDNSEGVIVHEVREDETLWKLTQVYQVDAAAIAASNGISANTELQRGMKLFIPPVNGLVHKVKSGETLDAIADYYKVSKSEIIKHTSLASGDFLAIDQSLVIPGNVSTLIQVKEDHVKRELLAEKERLAKRLQELEGKKSVATLASAKADSKVANQDIGKQPKYSVYKVQNGDTIETIARRYGITQKSIIEANKLENPQWLELNQELNIPQDKTVSNFRTVASSLNDKPVKQVPSPIVGEKTEAEAIRVKAATPMTLPKSEVSKLAAANRVSPWEGLAQITGADKPSNQRLITSTPVVSQPKQSPSDDSLSKVAAALLPFEPNQLLNSLGDVKGDKSQVSINVPARSIVPPSIPAPTVSEQFSNGSAPIELKSSQPVVELKLPTVIAAALAVPQVQPIAPAINPSSAPRGISLQSLTPKTAAVAAPTVPASVAVEQSSNAGANPTDLVAQPAAEPKVEIPAQLAASLAPKIPASTSIEQASFPVSQPSQVALLPDAEVRMTSLEVKRLEAEVDQLSAKVREAEAREAARKAEELRKLEATKLAAANLNGIPNPDRNFDSSRSVIADPSDRSRFAPELPQLTASAYLPDVNSYGLSTGFIWPADGVFTSAFGWRWGRMHQGIDIASSVGTPILAAASGVVEYAQWNDGGYGNMIDIRHSDGTITRYAHMNALYVKEGQTVSQGQTIGEMGSTGFSTGPHLHFEIRPNGGSAIDPMTFLAQAVR